MKIPVFSDIEELKKFLNEHKNSNICLYLAYKDEEGWEKSTSRVYMDKVLSNFFYLPVNIKKEDNESLKEIYVLAKENPQVVAINITQPHKSNLVMKQLFSDNSAPSNIDTIVKDKKGELVPYDVNAPSFLDWFNEEVGDFHNKSVVLLGVGGFGEPLAKRLAKQKLKTLVLIDMQNKEQLKEELSEFGNVAYYPSLENLKLEHEKEIVFINAAGKEGIANNFVITKFLKKYGNKNNIFVDIRPHLDIDIVNKAKELGWKSYTGFGMNARNDYTMLKAIANNLEMSPPPFSDFKKLVKDAS